MALIVPIKTEFKRVAGLVGATFADKSFPELEKFLQQFDFSTSLINLDPVMRIKSNIMISGAPRYNVTFDLYFLIKFKKSDTLESNKDFLIDTMIDLQERFFIELNKNEALIFINPHWTWTSEILRQFTSNLTVGIKTSIDLDTACNRIKANGVFDYTLDAPMN